MARILQIMHAHAMSNGTRCQWAHFFQPPAEMLARLSQTPEEESFSWEALEPEYSE